MKQHGVSVADLVEGAHQGNPRSVARLISLVEDGSPLLPEVMAALVPLASPAHVIGLTGPPGVGKSTTTSALVRVWRDQGRRVGVLAVDPSSPFSGGAFLGDRVRMAEHALDASVYIRSMAARGHLGGLSSATPQAIRVLEAAGCDIVLIETVGVGQSEVEVATLADTTVVLAAPGMGDAIQAAKAGILEVGDLLVVNKADCEGADRVRRELRTILTSARRSIDAWVPPVLTAIASRAEGIEQVAAELDRHRQHLTATGEQVVRRERRARAEIEALTVAALRAQWQTLAGNCAVDALASAVAAGDLDPYTAAQTLRSSS